MCLVERERCVLWKRQIACRERHQYHIQHSRVDYYSNFNVTYNGVRVGSNVPPPYNFADPPHSGANNARVMIDNAWIYPKFRQAVCQHNEAEGTYGCISNCGGMMMMVTCMFSSFRWCKISY